MLTKAAALAVALLALNVSQVPQVFEIAVALVAVLAVGRSKQKDATIETLQDLAEARLGRIKDLEASLAGASARADEAQKLAHESEKKVEKLAGRLEEMSKYTAQSAFEELTSLARELADLATQRHAQMLERQERFERTIVGAVENQGELVMKANELTARVLERLT